MRGRRAARPWWARGPQISLCRCARGGTNRGVRRRCEESSSVLADVSPIGQTVAIDDRIRVLGSGGLGVNGSTHGGGQVIALLVGGKGVVLDVFPIVLYGCAHKRRRIAVAAHELGRGRKSKIHEIVEDEDLAVAVGPGSNADGGNGQL